MTYINRNQLLILAHHLSIVIGLVYFGFNLWYATGVFFISMMWAKFVGSDVMHFYFAHGKYTDSFKSYFFTFLTLCTALGSPLSFSASHRQHHAHTDTTLDPHSPAIIGWANVYFLNWKSQKISPTIIKDFVRSKFQKWIHKYWIESHLVIIFVLGLIDIKLVCFMISPFVVYTFHIASLTNTLSHKYGVPRNATELRLLSWWGWNHADHHNY